MAEFSMPSFPRKRESSFVARMKRSAIREAAVVERPPAAIQPHKCGWLRPCTLGDFSLFAQRKITKRKRAPWSTPASRVPSHARLRRMRTRGIPAAPLQARASAVLGARLDQGEIFKTRMARLSTARLWASAPKGARAGSTRLTRATGKSRRGSAGPQSCGAPVSAPSGVFFFLVTFSWTSKNKSPAVGLPPAIAHRRRRIDKQTVR